MKRMIAKVLLAVLFAGILTGGGLFAAVCICAGRERKAVPSDCIIVLGARVWPSGRMSNSLRYRCESALEAWKDGLGGSVIVCGAQGDNEPATEALVMRAWFIQNGVPENRVIAEDASVNTEENLRNAKAIMDEKGWKSAVVVTSDYHVERSLWIARDAGIEACAVAAKSPTKPSSWLLSRVREPISWVLYRLRKLLR